MSLINVLSKEVSELIAAGEVIERPSSVIKELVENSVDSGARHITVEIKNGGSTYIRVTDDGCGMAFDDVPTAFIRHATSKITKKEDLDSILTLGFRGEALASVAAVSKVEVMTKLKDEEMGTLYGIEGSVETYHERGGCPDGTTIIIRELFYNVPARRKFLRKDVTESNAVSQILRKITMSHPEIAFKFIRDNKLDFNSSGDGELFSAVYAVYGRDFVRDLMEVEYEYNGIRVEGYIVKPLYSRNNRAFQNFFVNGRYVQSKLCSAAIETAYNNMLMTGKFPACVLMITVSPETMDVNIHPSKAQVRFTDEKSVTDAIYFAVKNSMMRNGLIYDFQLKNDPKNWDAPVPEIDESVQQEFIFTPVNEIQEVEKSLAEKKYAPPVSDIPAPKPERIEVKEIERPMPTQEEQDENACTEILPEIPLETELAPDKISYEPPPPEAPQTLDKFKYLSKKSFEVQEDKVVPLQEKKSEWTEKPKIRVIGEAFGVYIIAETEDKSMVMIDKHAAHERIIFEKLKARNCRQYSQMLIKGVKVLMTEEEISSLEENVELLEDMGFVFDFSEKPCVIATSVPTFVMDLDIEEIISEISENLRMHSRDPQSHALDDMLHTVACKSAIRGNDKNDIRELQALAEEVYSNDAIRHCPHGRPVMFTMSKSNIEHQFGRT